MTEFESIFNPVDDSLEARVDAYRSVHKEWLNAEASLQFIENDEWGDTLGDREEVQKALSISTSSLYYAADSFTEEEVSEASKTHLLESEEAQELLENKRHHELQKLQNREAQDSDTFENSR